ncbi:hypothetical protein AAMO2058_000728300 [Amorphochlora amoebiformis]
MSYMAEFGEADQEAQINYMIKNGLIPCVEFDSKGDMYRENSRMPGYYDGRYWSMWKLPMFGATDARSVMAEVRECQRYNPNAYIRILGFDNVKQVQCMGFLVGKPQGYRSSQAATPSYGSSQSSHGASSESSGSSESSYGSAYQSSVSNWQQQAQHQAQHQTQHQTQHQAHQPTQQQSYDYQHGAGTQPASQSKSQWSFDSYGPGSGSESMSRASFESKASGYKSLVGGSSVGALIDHLCAYLHLAQEELNGINQRISLLEESLSTRLAHVESAIEKAVETLNHQQQ